MLGNVFTIGRVFTFEECFAAIFHSMDGHDQGALHPSLFDTHLVVESVMEKIEQLEAKMNVSVSTLDHTALVANVRVLKGIVVALMDKMSMMRKTMTSLAKDFAILKRKKIQEVHTSSGGDGLSKKHCSSYASIRLGWQTKRQKCLARQNNLDVFFEESHTSR